MCNTNLPKLCAVTLPCPPHRRAPIHPMGRGSLGRAPSGQIEDEAPPVPQQRGAGQQRRLNPTALGGELQAQVAPTDQHIKALGWGLCSQMRMHREPAQLARQKSPRPAAPLSVHRQPFGEVARPEKSCPCDAQRAGEVSTSGEEVEARQAVEGQALKQRFLTRDHVGEQSLITSRGCRRIEGDRRGRLHWTLMVPWVPVLFVSL